MKHHIIVLYLGLVLQIPSNLICLISGISIIKWFQNNQVINFGKGTIIINLQTKLFKFSNII